MNTDIATKYPWVPFYEAVATKLLDYKERDGRKELARIMAGIAEKYQCGQDLFSIRPNWGKNHDKSEPYTLIEDVSPYTVFFFMAWSNSIKNYVTNKRVEIIRNIGDVLNIPQNITRPSSNSDFYGIPTPNCQSVNQSRWDWIDWHDNEEWYLDERLHKHKDIIWNQYELAIEYAEGDTSKLEALKREYDIVSSIPGVGDGLARGMFQIRPRTYLTIDRNTRKYLGEYGLSISQKLSGDEYFSLLDHVITKIINNNPSVNSFLDISHLAYIKKGSESEKRNYWMVGYNQGSTNNQWERFEDEGIWDGFVSVSDDTQIQRLKKIKPDDVLILKSSYTKGTQHNISAVKLFKLAIVDSVSELSENNSYGVRCNVDYIDVAPKEFVNFEGSYRKTIDPLVDQNILEFVKSVLEPSCGNTEMSSTTSELATRYAEFLKRSRNLILTGAPGTGKTYLAKQIAQAMNEGLELKKEELEKYVGFVQFHPSYDYVDFVEGLRPDRSGDNVVFKRDDGIFKKFCKKAIKDHEHNYVFIIDEINRGDLSKIFGELFFAIDPGYRGEEGRVKTQYQQLVDAEDDDEFSGEGFYVPDNVYIIGTMNDIDRSVESMDFALRRRFAWKKISPEDTAESMGITGEVRQRMDAMNKAICSIPELGEDYQIGGAYFLKMVKEDLSAEDLWDFHLESLIDEYLRGLPNKDELYKKIKNAYDNPRKTNDETKPQENSTED